MPIKARSLPGRKMHIYKYFHAVARGTLSYDLHVA